MQVASTLWPGIKLYKISEHRFRLKWTKCSPRTQFKPLKTGRDQHGSDKGGQKSPPEESWGLLAPWAGRPTRPMGPTASALPRGASPLVPLTRALTSALLPAYNIFFSFIYLESTYVCHTISYHVIYLTPVYAFEYPI
jgi:hypothetical protein